MTVFWGELMPTILLLGTLFLAGPVVAAALVWKDRLRSAAWVNTIPALAGMMFFFQYIIESGQYMAPEVSVGQILFVVCGAIAVSCALVGVGIDLPRAVFRAGLCLNLGIAALLLGVLFQFREGVWR